MQVLKVKVKPQKDRLDQFVSDSIKNISRSKAKKLIKDGLIIVNDQLVDPSYKVSKADKIKIEIPAVKEISLKAENIPLKIIFEDRDLLVIDKPAFLVTHPTLDHPSGTVVNAVLNHLQNAQTGSLRPGIAHRLDKNTSGVLVIAKNQETLENLKSQFKNKTVSKTYLALVHGVVQKEKGTISESILRHPKFRSKFIVGQGGREAETDYKVLQRLGNFTLLELKPKTGRTHQIRVHLSHLGHPIVGDKLYGGKMLLNRQFLHAERLELSDPKTGKKLVFESELPADLDKFLKKLSSV